MDRRHLRLWRQVLALGRRPAQDALPVLLQDEEDESGGPEVALHRYDS